MPARSIGSGTISFGLVSIPIRMYVATHSEQLSFNMLHRECGTRIRQQLYCPRDERVVERSEIVKGYQFQPDRYVTFTDEELRALEAQAVSRGKEELILIRPLDGGLALHSMYHADEVRPFKDIDTGGEPKLKANELELARRLVEQLATKSFHPEQYEDHYRERVEAMV